MKRATAEPDAEKRMQKAFEELRGHIQEHGAHEVVELCMDTLCVADTRESMRSYPPWFLLRLIEWAFRYGRSQPARGKRFTEEELAKLVALIIRMNDEGEALTTRATPHALVKNMAHEQRALQLRKPRCDALARNLVLFLDLNRSSRIPDRFLKLTGMPIEGFLRLACALSFYFEKSVSSFVTAQDVSRLRRECERYAAQFLASLSLPVEEVRGFLAGRPQPSRSWFYQLHKESELMRKPLLGSGGRFRPYHRPLLFRSLETYAYDTLREDDAGTLMEPFREAFQEYVGASIEDSGLTHVKEDELRKYLPSGSKVVDHLIPLSDANVLIEDKAVEMHPLGRVSWLAEVLEGKLKSSIIKGIVQGNDVASALAATSQVGRVSLSGGPWYLLIVTYKHLYVAAGSYLEHIIGTDGMAHVGGKVGSRPTIPHDNVFFLSVAEFDSLMGCVQSGYELAAILNRARDKYSRSAVWVFDQVLEEYGDALKCPRHLGEAMRRHLVAGESDASVRQRQR